MILKNAFYSPSFDNCERLVEYLTIVAGKALTPFCIRQNIFKTSWSKRDVKLRSRSQMQAAIAYLKYLLGGKDVDENHRLMTTRTIIADLAPYVKQLDENQDLSFLIGNTNILPSTIHYKHAKQLFYDNQLSDDSRNRYSIDLLVLYALRLSLEKRILGFLGIDFVTDGQKPVQLSRLVTIVKGLNNIQYKVGVDWDQIEWVNDWLNHFMHRHLRPYPWSIHQAFLVLDYLLEPSQVVDGDTIYNSFYASTYVKDDSKLKIEIEQKIKNTIPRANIEWGENEILRKK